ncbi:TPA: restriction endonuclease subunit S [Streptococcus suis]
MKTNNNIPAYRFQGYTDAWELRKLGEVAEINPKSQVPETFQYVDLESVVGTNLISHRTESINSAPSRAQRLALYGDIFYQTVRPYQKNNYLFDLPYKNYVFSTGYAQLRPKIDSRYLMIKIQDDGFVKEVLDRCTGTSYPAINSKDLSQISIDVPVSLSEQEAIGIFFSTLDQQITLHQRKLDTLKEQKKTYLKLLFPAKGQTQPALRFQGFEDDWEEVKLGEVLEERNVQQLPQEDTPLVSFTVENGVTPKTDRYDREFLVRTGDKKYKYTELDDIVYNPANLKFGAISRNKFGKAVFSPIYVTLVVNKSKVFANFIEGIVTKRDFIQEALQYQEGTVYERMAVKVSDFLSMKISLPSLPEQEAIGTFFQTLDQEIAQVEDKLASLKEMKKTLLRKLFV